MNIDFHYYGTYVAARLAGYDFDSAGTIAYAAQYVDDSDEDSLKDGLNRYIINDFTPNPTIQGLTDMMKKNFDWSEGALNSIKDIWVPFHFLPGNYGNNPDIKQYHGPMGDRGTLFSWNYDEESEKQFKLLCKPNSLLVGSMINDVIKNHLQKDYTLQIAGLRMHVLADTWAHMFYAGFPEWFINNVSGDVYQVNGTGKTVVKWRRVWPWADSTDIIAGESATPDMLSYNSVVYLGHGRMGHLPDYPWLTYQYRPQWSDTDITKNNTSYFLSALKQMTYALTCIKNGTEFSVDTYANLPATTEQVVNTVLSTKVNDQCTTWKNHVGDIQIGGVSLQVPPVYDKTLWKTEALTASVISSTSYYHFNNAARMHLELVRDTLEANNLNIDTIPRGCVVTTKFKTKKGNYIGKMYKQVEYYPKINTTPLSLEIIKPTPQPLTSGDIVEIKTTEESVGKYNFLGAWSTPSLYYYTRAYSPSKQKWKIEKKSGSSGDQINAGDQVQFLNMYYESKPYMATYSYILGGTYLTTQADGTKDNTIWIMDGLVEFNIYVITPDYFVSPIVNQQTSTMIYTAMKTYGMIDAQGNVQQQTLKYTLGSVGLGFLPQKLNQDQQEQVNIQLWKLVQ